MIVPGPRPGREQMTASALHFEGGSSSTPTENLNSHCPFSWHHATLQPDALLGHMNICIGVKEKQTPRITMLTSFNISFQNTDSFSLPQPPFRCHPWELVLARICEYEGFSSEDSTAVHAVPPLALSGLQANWGSASENDVFYQPSIAEWRYSESS